MANTPKTLEDLAKLSEVDKLLEVEAERLTPYLAPGVSVNRRPNGKRRTSLGLTVAAAAALAAGAGAVIYANWDDIKGFFKWGKLANEAAADSVLLLETKVDRAIALCDGQGDTEVLKHAISSAQEEARNLVAINQQLRDRLKAALSKSASKA